MKKLILTMLASISSLPIYALYSGNPADPSLGTEHLYFQSCDWFVPKLGYARDYVTDRKLKSNTLATQRIDLFAMTSNLGYVAFDLTDHCRSFLDGLEIYGAAGDSTISFHARPATGFQTNYKFVSKDGFAWGAGLKAILWQNCNTLISVSGQYQSTHTPLAIDSVETTAPNNASINYHEWQASVGIAERIGCFVPYLSVNFSGLVDSKITDLDPSVIDVGDSFTLETRHLVGLGLGTSFIASPYFYLTAEARLINETSFTIAGYLRF